MDTLLPFLKGNNSCETYNFIIKFGNKFSPDTPASSTTKAGRHDIAEILLTVALSTKNQKYPI
jgi:hypothetical protein